MGAEVEIVRAEAEGGAQDDFVEDGGGGVDEKVAALGGADDAEKIAGVDLGDGNEGALAEEVPRLRHLARATRLSGCCR